MLESELLFAEFVYPVCTPDYLQRNPNIKFLDHLPKADLLHVEEDKPTVANWDLWLNQYGLESQPNQRQQMYNDYTLLIQSCLLGQGVLLGWHHMIFDLLASGELVRPVSEVQKTDIGFYVVWPTDSRFSSETQLFYEWITAQAKVQLDPE